MEDVKLAQLVATVTLSTLGSVHLVRQGIMPLQLTAAHVIYVTRAPSPALVL